MSIQQPTYTGIVIATRHPEVAMRQVALLGYGGPYAFCGNGRGIPVRETFENPDKAMNRKELHRLLARASYLKDIMAENPPDSWMSMGVRQIETSVGYAAVDLYFVEIDEAVAIRGTQCKEGLDGVPYGNCILKVSWSPFGELRHSPGIGLATYGAIAMALEAVPEVVNTL